MPIPESQLDTWSRQGATVAAAATHTSLKAALRAHDWPEGMTYHTYLQGSYANATNIRGNSDVDLVVQSDAVFYSNLTEEEKRARNLRPGRFGFQQFKAEVVHALTQYYGAEAVKVGDKSIKIAPASGRLAADVIPCIEYREYRGGELYAVGMTFWSKSGAQIVNFPKLHIENGEEKNSKARTNGWYKPTVRMFKNAREWGVSNASWPEGLVPSYFLECLIFNASDACFGPSFQRTYWAVVRELLDRVRREPERLVCQNCRRWLFGNDSTQWNREDAELALQLFAELWDDWYR